MGVAVNEGFQIKSLDATSAFLQGSPLERDVYIEPPEERRKEGIVWCLKKTCYGLYDASRSCYLAVKEELSKLGMKTLSGDEAFFYLHDENQQLIGLCILHVDDFLFAGHKELQ